MKSAVRAAAGLVAIAAVASLLVMGSQAIRGAHLLTADVVDSPSPYPQVSPTCVPGEGVECPGAPCLGMSCGVPVLDRSPEPDPGPAAPEPPTTGVAGTIQVSWWLALLPGSPGKMGITIRVLSGSQFVSGATVNGHCSGPGVDVTVSAVTAPRSAWPSTVDPSTPNLAGGFIWQVETVNVEQGGKYICHGTATYGGMSAGF